ncbi:hypoxia induced protein [Humitalea rosea]|uniref:Hypoxia induced protein n=1 Tax=Humitalea rosea TaxID=990373 RepID=A0A2W7I7R4_9PROT|nr:twin transmembrane helix small protein [Humitalea rosea]PZW42208.1 hypoxia induced protein [Humitalea rosea]
MKTFLTFLVVAAMLGTLGVLAAGLIGMARGNSGARSNALMRWRVVLQGAALVLFMLLITLMRG